MIARAARVPLGALLLAACGSGGEATTGASTTGGATSTSTGGPGSSSTGAPTTSATGTAAGSSGTTGQTGTTEAVDDSSTGTTADSSTGVESSSTGDTTTGPPPECATLPQGPLPYTIKDGPYASEDLAFDHEGNLIGVQDGNLFKSPFDGPPVLWVAGAGQFVAGLRMTSLGVLVFSDTPTGTMFRINPGQDFKEVVVGGLEYSNGVEVDLHGFVYTAEQSGARVRRIDPATGEFSFLAEGLDNPNGLSFSPDYRTLYVGSFGGGTITALKLGEDMTSATVEPFANITQHGGGGALDGMAVDACGNVYVCEFGPATIWRITPDGLSVTRTVELGLDTGWIPNMQWGSGIGGWDPNTMYVLDFSANRVFEVPLGIGDKPRGYP